MAVELTAKRKRAAKPPKPRKLSELEQAFLSWWGLLAPRGAPQPEANYRFHPVRRWMADFAWPDSRVLVEMEGGTFARGRHVRPMGFRRDAEKYNAATLMGFKVLRYTSDMLIDDPAGVVNEIASAVLGLKGSRNAR